MKLFCIFCNKTKYSSIWFTNRCGPLIDLCRGPHVRHTGKIKAMAVTKVGLPTSVHNIFLMDSKFFHWKLSLLVCDEMMIKHVFRAFMT